MKKRVDVSPSIEMWRAYEYFDGGHMYHPAVYESGGGPEGVEHVWADDSMWTIDTPETPNSILCLLHYSSWKGERLMLDLRNASMTVSLKSENLKLHGARCYFWIHTYAPTSTRWHYVAKPLLIPSGEWSAPQTIDLSATEEGWHRSFSLDKEQVVSLPEALNCCASYGFSFVGFSEKVTGKIMLADFRLTSEVESCWPYSLGKENRHKWLTVSGRQKRQLSVDDGTTDPLEKGPDNRARESLITLAGDFCVLNNTVPFCYLAFVRAADATNGHALQGAYFVFRHSHDLELQGGHIAFFVEHAPSGTRFAYRYIFDESITNSAHLYDGILRVDTSNWLRLTGEAPLQSVLAGREGEYGYDHFGFMIIGMRDVPIGSWSLNGFSLAGAEVEMVESSACRLGR